MLQINGKTYFKPSEIAEQGLIVNTKGKSDYKFVLRQIRLGRLPAKHLNDGPDVQLHYYIVAEDDIKAFNNKRTGDK